MSKLHAYQIALPTFGRTNCQHIICLEIKLDDSTNFGNIATFNDTLLLSTLFVNVHWPGSQNVGSIIVQPKGKLY